MVLLIPNILMALTQLATPSSRHLDRTWVVRELIPGVSDFQLADRSWREVTLLGDTDGDLMSDFCCLAEEYPVGGQGVNWRGWYQFGSAGNLRSLFVEEFYPYPSGLLDDRAFMMTRLGSPLGNLALLLVRHPPYFASFLPPDYSNPIVSGASIGMAHLRFPDQNGDSYDEIVQYDRDGPFDTGLTTLLDGATMQRLWEHRDQPIASLGWYRPANVNPWPDLNGDTRPDVITSWANWHGTSFSAVILALDGPTGQQLWRYEDPLAQAIFPIADCPDVTNDGVPDIVFAVFGISLQRVVMLDGALGVPSWTADIRSYIPLNALPGHQYRNLSLTLVPTPIPERPGEAEILMEVIFEPFWHLLPDAYRYFHLDARSGSFLGFVSKPNNLEPWLPDPYDSSWFGSPYRERIGDWDRDGLVEVATYADTWSIDKPNNITIPRNLVILGLETLTVPGEKAPGTSFTAKVSIPSAPNHDFTLLISRGFDRAGGLVVDGWRTFLVPDALLQVTLGGAFTGRLDQDGVGAVGVQVPNQPSLAGATLYSKAVVWKPGSASEVWTLSSLGVTNIR